MNALVDVRIQTVTLHI